MKTLTLSALALTAALATAGLASAQVPSGGAGTDAKGNAPIKHAHTTGDGAARRGHTSFTEAQARQHITNAGYGSVSGLTKGEDGVWRGTATRNGAGPVEVGLDFKGNVSEGGADGGAKAMTTTSSTTRRMAAPAARTEAATGGAMAPEKGAMTTDGAMAGSSTMATSTTTASTSAGMHRQLYHRRHHHHAMNRCADPAPNGAACSGIDRNRNGVSDKEDRALKAGAHP